MHSGKTFKPANLYNFHILRAVNLIQVNNIACQENLFLPTSSPFQPIENYFLGAAAVAA